MRVWKWVVVFVAAETLLVNEAWLERSFKNDLIRAQVALSDSDYLIGTTSRMQQHIRLGCCQQLTSNFTPIGTAHEQVQEEGCFGPSEIGTSKIIALDFQRKGNAATLRIWKDNSPINAGIPEASVVKLGVENPELRGDISIEPLARQRDLCVNKNITSRPSSNVFYIRSDIDYNPAIHNAHTIWNTRNQFDPRSLLVSHNAIGLSGSIGSGNGGSGSSAGFSQGEGNVDDADSSYAYAGSRYDNHPERPKRHVALGYEIVLAPLMLIGGFYYLAYALRHGGRLSLEAIAFYALLGMGGVLCGVALGFIAAYGA